YRPQDRPAQFRSGADRFSRHTARLPPALLSLPGSARHGGVRFDGHAEAALQPHRTQHKRIAGLGIAMPFELWSWADTAGAPREVMDEWRHRDMRTEIQLLCDFPVYLQNDATSACGAELVFGQT